MKKLMSRWRARAQTSNKWDRDVLTILEAKHFCAWAVALDEDIFDTLCRFGCFFLYNMYFTHDILRCLNLQFGQLTSTKGATLDVPHSYWLVCRLLARQVVIRRHKGHVCSDTIATRRHE